ncbi:MAG: sulfurtransferase [Pseudomonadota bacterium]
MLVDGTWTLPGSTDDTDQAIIEGAVHFDLDDVCEPSTSLPHMAPTRAQVSDWSAENGIAFGTPVVIIDNNGMFSSPRVWWTFRRVGWEHASVVNGGSKAWLDAGSDHRKTNDELDGDGKLGVPQDGTDKVGAFKVASSVDIRAAIASGTHIIVDARPQDRFKGDAAEPRKGLRSGAIPGSINLPYKDLITDNGYLKPMEQIKSLLGEIGISEDSKVISTCGSGVSASILILAMEAIGWSNHMLYDGSWAEWGQPDENGDRPIVTTREREGP